MLRIMHNEVLIHLKRSKNFMGNVKKYAVIALVALAAIWASKRVPFIAKVVG